MTQVKCQAFNNIAESRFSTACAVGPFHLGDPANYLLTSSLFLVFEQVVTEGQLMQLINAPITTNAPGQPQVGTLAIVEPLIGVGAANTGAALVAISNAGALAGVPIAGAQTDPVRGMAVRIHTEGGVIQGTIAADTVVAPAPVINGRDISDCFTVRVPANSLVPEDSGARVMDASDTNWIGMFLYQQDGLAFCSRASNIAL